MPPKAKKQSTLTGFFTRTPKKEDSKVKAVLNGAKGSPSDRTPSKSKPSPSVQKKMNFEEGQNITAAITEKLEREAEELLDDKSSKENKDAHPAKKAKKATPTKSKDTTPIKTVAPRRSSGGKKSNKKIINDSDESDNDDDGGANTSGNNINDDIADKPQQRDTEARMGLRRSSRSRNSRAKMSFDEDEDDDWLESSSSEEDEDSDGYVPDDVDDAIMKEDESLNIEMTNAVAPMDEEEDDAALENEEEAEEDNILTDISPKKNRSKKVRTPSKTPLISTSSSTTTRSGIVMNLNGLPPELETKGKKNDARYGWLVHPRDKNGKGEGEKDYDPTTLHIPQKAWEKFTPFEKQYWEVKQYHWNTILFFKKGKFYELYERDAEIGNREFQLRISDRVNMCMAGVPEATFTDWAARFLARGYRVAKADERENAIAKKMRENMSGKKGAKIIERKLAAVYTAGTLTGDFVVGDMSNYIMSIKENAATRTYGVCFADTATANFNLCYFTDDPARMTLETLVVQTMPKEIVLCKGAYSSETMAILKQTIPNGAFNIRDATQFWNSSTTLDNIERAGYFSKSESEEDGPYSHWPSGLQEYFDKEETMSAFGGLIAYFKSLLIDEDLLSQGSFSSYDPMNQFTSLVLDGQTLQNLDIITNSADGTSSGSLFELICHCYTSFGKRQFRRWVCHPLCKEDEIIERQNAVEDFDANMQFKDELASLLKPLPDLERLLSRIHVGNCKLSDFLTTLDAFEALSEGMERIESIVAGISLLSSRLEQLTKVGGLFPKMNEQLSEMARLFDSHQARENNTFAPAPGAHKEYDNARKNMKRIKEILEDHLSSVQSKFRSGTHVKYWQPSAGRERYQIQVPNQYLKHVPSNWKLMSSTKNFKRYHSPKVQELVQEFLEAEELESQILKSFFSDSLKVFDAHSAVFSSAVFVLSELDCLLSLHTAKEVMSGGPMCRPIFVPEEQGKNGPKKAVLDVKELRHPCLKTVSSFIPNDTTLGGSTASCMLLTGPNMGGKSTLLRQICIAVIMAQMGCWVPAESMRLSVVDRIFTRIGANDNIVAGRSTFMVELKETAIILNKATPSSLVILDELGRGTSTFDGFSIAYAVINHIAEKIGCRCMFATHYHLLTDEMKRKSNVSNFNMACVVDENQRDVTFLYKLQPGVCSKSYGMNVAHMAGVLDSVVDCAKQKAVHYEATSKFGLLQDRRTKQLALQRFKDEVDELLCSSESMESKKRELQTLVTSLSSILSLL
eukprot:m.13709 g.13709  ORF g.13709 m.13709 type:complete len:1251 (+) comp4189_c0_seq1:110-3862(+)